jgi:hypothetical protein
MYAALQMIETDLNTVAVSLLDLHCMFIRRMFANQEANEDEMEVVL